LPVEFDPWAVLQQELMLSIRPWLEVWREKVRLPDGRVIPDYYKVVAPAAALVVAMTPESRLLLPVSTGTRSAHDLGVAAPLEPGDAVQCAQRELLEEAGYAPKSGSISARTFVTRIGAVPAPLFLALAPAGSPSRTARTLNRRASRCSAWTRCAIPSARPDRRVGSVTGLLLANFYMTSPPGSTRSMADH